MRWHQSGRGIAQKRAWAVASRAIDRGASVGTPSVPNFWFIFKIFPIGVQAQPPNFPRKLSRTSYRKIPRRTTPEELPPKIFPKIFPNFFSKQMHHFITIFFGKIFGNIFGNIFGDAFGAISGVADCSLFSLVPLATLFFSLPVNPPIFFYFLGDIFSHGIVIFGVPTSGCRY